MKSPQKFLGSLPSKPGIYRMLGKKDNLLYVGKAKDLKKRIPHYFQSKLSDPKSKFLMTKVCNIEFTVTNTETEALLLEYTLIKKNKPKYNVVLRDDKSYPYIYLSDNHDYPRVEFKRKNRHEKGKYFGPYPNVTAVKETLAELQKVFLVRQCKDSFFKNRSRPCLQYQIKRCSAPCVDLISKEEYSNDVKSTVSFLKGRNTSIVNSLARKMDKLSDKQKYEEASRCRDQIKRLKVIQAKQLNTGNNKHDMDVIGIASSGSVHCVTVLFVRNGIVSGSKNHYLRISGYTDKMAIQYGFLTQHYFAIKPPPEIIVPESLNNKELMEDSFSIKSGRKVRLSNKVRGHRLRWLTLANNNAKHGLQYKTSNESSLASQFNDLGGLFLKNKIPKRLECFDVSHISGEATVASCVVFNNAGPLKNEYRRFNIKSSHRGDDYIALSEAITRRYQKVIKNEAKMPDILFLDGGKGQLSSCVDVLRKLGITNLKVIAIAKGRSRKPTTEQLFVAARKTPLKLPVDSPAMHLIRRIRDEAHRFAVIGHRQKRRMNRNKSRLDGIEGLGPKRRKELLKQFGGIHGVIDAGVDDLMKVQGISKLMSIRIYNNLHNSN
ncbi:MAG: excinuclease ABC subunit UvrC [Pseudomonadota bacterium]|nr:excinuclease ABC subunit UvrC [Pseudomonadota bacterium]